MCLNSRARALVQAAHRSGRQAHGHVPVEANVVERVDEDVRDRADGVAHVRGAHDRQEDVGPGPHAPAAQGLAEVRAVALDTELGGHIQDATQAARVLMGAQRSVTPGR